MSSSFLLLELTDPALNAFLWQMRDLVSGQRRSRSAVHVTLRGPYEGEPPIEVLDRARRQLRGDVLRIHGVGRFSNVDGEVIFLRVDSIHLRDVWWKPSFNGFEPHISIYRGSETALADVIERFLADVHVDIPCAEYRLVWHRSGQRDLFDENEPTVGAMQQFAVATRFDPEILDRLTDTLSAYRKTLLHTMND